MDDQRLSRLFHEAGSAHVPAQPPVAEALHLGRRAVRSRRLVQATLAAVVIGVVTLTGVTLLAGRDTGSDADRFADPAPIGGARVHLETTGSTVNTWTNYQTGGGTAGPQIPVQTQVEITCRVEGYQVTDGNVWWYRIHTAPWSDVYYGSADAFYNGAPPGGTLKGTPFYDPDVPIC